MYCKNDHMTQGNMESQCNSHPHKYAWLWHDESAVMSTYGVHTHT